MKCKNEKCNKELPKNHGRKYCDGKCMEMKGRLQQAKMNNKNAVYGECIICGDITRRKGRYTPRYCEKPDCQKAYTKERAAARPEREKRNRIQRREKDASNEKSILLPDGSIPEYYLTRGDIYAHGICSR